MSNTDAVTMSTGPDRGLANIMNWRSSPHARWAFRNIREIIPTATIANDPTDALPLPEALQSFDEFRLVTGDGAELDLKGFLSVTATDAFVVLVDGKIVFEFYDAGMTGRTPHIVMSMTKAITGLVGSMLHQAGALDLDTPASDYVQEIGTSGYHGVTTRQLLDMRAEILWDAAEQRSYNTATNWDAYPSEQAGFGFHAFLANTKPGKMPHGGPFSYISSNTDLVGWVLERATGRSFASLTSELLWKPLGAADEAFITLDRLGAARCSGGLCATPRDLARLGQIMINGGCRGTRPVIPQEVIHDIGQNGDRNAWQTGAWAESFSLKSGRSMSYRSGWYTVDDDLQTVFAMGTHGQNLFLDPVRRLVVVKLSSQGVSIDRPALTLTRAAMTELTHCSLRQRLTDGRSHADPRGP